MIRLVGGGVLLGPLGTAATDWPIVPAPGDYDDGEFDGMKMKPNYSEKTRPSATLSTTNPNWPDPGIEPGPPRWEARDYPPELWHGLVNPVNIESAVVCFSPIS
jgi:hypothetical protein